MFLTVYSFEYRAQFPADILQLLLRHLPADIREKAGKFRRWQDAHAFIFGKHLLMTALQEEGFPNQLSALQYTSNGRPHLPNGPDFNLTHSGNRVACAISRHGRLGIDIEEVRNLDITDFQKQFSAREWQSITTSADPLRTFYHYWTAKESAIKADGRGLTLPLNELNIETGTGMTAETGTDTAIHTDTCTNPSIHTNATIRIDTVTWHLQNIHHLFPGYACHIASEYPPTNIRLRDIPVSGIIR
jgi:4'-phosphopantetheinyl transferase